MNTLPIIWQEIGSYLQYANARELALLTINASILALATASYTSDTTSTFLIVLRPSLFSYIVMLTLISISQVIIFVSFLPTLRGSAPVDSRWVAIARFARLLGPAVPATQRNPFYFGEISQFRTALLYFEHLKNNHRNIVSEAEANSPTAYACAHQVWYLSVLTTKKFAQFYIAMGLVWAATFIHLIVVSLHVEELLCQAQ